MKIKTPLTLFCLLLSICSYSQVINLHPSVGDTITREEAIKYYLFPEVETKTFNHIVLLQTDEGISAYFMGDNPFNKQISEVQLAEFRQNMTKLDESLYTLKNDASPTLVYTDSLMYKDIDMKLMTDEQKVKMLKDARRQTYLKLKADEMGLHGNVRDDFINNSGVLFFNSVKTKKKEKKTKKKKYKKK